MPEEFRSLSAMLLGLGVTEPQIASVVLEPSLASRRVASDVASVAFEHPRIVDLLDSFIVELTRLTARAAEHLEERAEALLADMAARVLGRELHSSPADIEALVAQAIADFSLCDPFVIRVASADAERFDSVSSIRVDSTFSAGDFAIDVADGSYDLLFQTRLDAMLASHRIAL